MIYRSDIRKKSEELNIPFENLLSIEVCYEILEIISETEFENEIYIVNYQDLGIDYGKNFSLNILYLEYNKELDCKLLVLYLRDVLKEIIAKAALKGIIIDGNTSESSIMLKVTVDKMYVPVELRFSMYDSKAGEPDEISICDLLMKNKSLKMKNSPKEEILAKHIIEILEKLELINDMNHYYETYTILKEVTLNGRKVKDRIAEMSNERNIKLDSERLNMVKSYENYRYMKNKWKVELRQKKKSEPEWKDLIKCLIKFLEPMWNTFETNTIFIGDWMPQIERFLD